MRLLHRSLRNGSTYVSLAARWKLGVVTKEYERDSSQGELAYVSLELMLHLRNLFADEDVAIHASTRANVPPHIVVRRHSPLVEVGHRGVSLRDDVHTLATRAKGLNQFANMKSLPDARGSLDH